MNRPIALVIAPFKTATPDEIAQRDRAIRELLDLGWCPIFLPYALQGALDDHDPAQRDSALQCSDAFVRLCARDPMCQAFLVGHRMTEGVQKDIDTWVIMRGRYPARL